MAATKSIRKELSTFLSWGKHNVIGYDEEVVGTKTYITKIWCKLCAKYKDQIKKDPSVKGAAINSLQAFSEGTNVVTKFQVDRHLRGVVHQVAEQLANNDGHNLTARKRPAQPDIKTSIENAATESYLKLMRTAYEMAITPSMPHKHFEVLVRCQRANGIRLVEGKNDNKAAREFVKYIADAVREKLTRIISKSNFIAMLSDGSQARKTKSEKELVLVRCERDGKPTYFVVSLLNMDDFGGTGSLSLKNALDSVFAEKNEEENIQAGNIPLSDYNTKLVSATADGANVNLGTYSGALTRLKHEREWLVLVHCVNHRLELAIKDAVSDMIKFKECDSFYTTLFYLFKNSGKLKAECQRAAAAMDITFYPLPKIHGTRFVNHRCRGFKTLVHNWPALITAFENTLATDNNCRGETRAKVTGIVKKLKSYRFLCQVAGYLDVLEGVGPLSLVFEAELLMAYDVQPAVDKTIANLEDLKDEGVEDLIDSYLNKFKIKDEDGLVTISANYVKAGHERKKSHNRDYIDIEIENMSFVDEDSIEAALSMRIEAIDILVPLIKDRFKCFIENEIFPAMTWLDPQYWEDNSKYAHTKIKKLAEIFEVPLEAAGFNLSTALNEWRSLRITVKSFYANLTASELWKKLFVYKKQEFKNILILVELMMCFSSSNSAVERIFSMLTTILSDRRLSMSHAVMEDCLLIAGNDGEWSQEDKQDILNEATSNYLKKRRTKQFADDKKKSKIEISDDDSSGEDDESSGEDREENLESDMDSESIL